MNLSRVLAGVGLVVVGVACGDQISTVQNQMGPLCSAVALVSLTPSTASIGINDTVRLAVSFPSIGGCAASPADKRVTFLSSKSEVATVDTAGLVTAHASGTATISAAMIVDPNQKGAALISVH
ncbi:MAG TPA: Ig-like domain-containing protein [Gemmatimonadaceae bacterium]